MRLIPDELCTSDLYYAAFLLTSGAKMSRTDRAGKRFFFVFSLEQDAGIDIPNLQLAWINSTAIVQAQVFTHHIKNLKSIVHAP